LRGGYILICPRCKKTLVQSEIDGETIETCLSCQGIWLNKNQLNAILSEHGGDFESCSIDDKPHHDKNPVIKCMHCEDVNMRKINFLDYSDIIMDYCPVCGGFWLDNGELSKIKEYKKKVEDGSHTVRNATAYNLLIKLSELAYSIFK